MDEMKKAIDIVWDGVLGAHYPVDIKEIVDLKKKIEEGKCTYKVACEELDDMAEERLRLYVANYVGTLILDENSEHAAAYFGEYLEDAKKIAIQIQKTQTRGKFGYSLYNNQEIVPLVNKMKNKCIEDFKAESYHRGYFSVFSLRDEYLVNDALVNDLGKKSFGGFVKYQSIERM